MYNIYLSIYLFISITFLLGNNNFNSGALPKFIRPKSPPETWHQSEVIRLKSNGEQGKAANPGLTAMYREQTKSLFTWSCLIDPNRL